MADAKHTPGETWEAVGMNVYRGKDCIGIFDTDNATVEIMEQRARIAAAAPVLLAVLNGAEGTIANAINSRHPDCKAERAELVAEVMKWVESARAAISKATGEA